MDGIQGSATRKRLSTIMPHSDQLPNPSTNDVSGWTWLQSRIERTELLAAAHEFDEWICSQLDALESNYQPMITKESQQAAAGSLVKPTRRKGT